MTGPTCDRCGAARFLWHQGEPAHEAGDCYWHDKQRALSNGGLPVAEIRTGVLDQILAAFDHADERQALRMRGIRYSVVLDGRTLELMA